MPFLPRNLPLDLQDRLSEFAQAHDFAELYKSYAWEQDTHQEGFPRILALEKSIRENALTNRISVKQIHDIAEWGKLPSINSIECSADAVNVRLCQSNGLPLPELADDPLTPLNELDGQTKGLGPTYLSKVLRFCLPSEYGSLDTRIVRVVGNGDRNSKRNSWLSLGVATTDHRFYIPRYQARWPSDYGVWTNILRFFANSLNNSNIQSCPHPAAFAEKKLREEGTWTCADVEMAIFSYASSCLHRS